MGAINTLADDYFTHLRMRPPKFRHIEDAGRWFADRDRLQHQAAFNVATQIWQDAEILEADREWMSKPGEDSQRLFVEVANLLVSHAASHLGSSSNSEILDFSRQLSERLNSYRLAIKVDRLMPTGRDEEVGVHQNFISFSFVHFHRDTWMLTSLVHGMVHVLDQDITEARRLTRQESVVQGFLEAVRILEKDESSQARKVVQSYLWLKLHEKLLAEVRAWDITLKFYRDLLLEGLVGEVVVINDLFGSPAGLSDQQAWNRACQAQLKTQALPQRKGPLASEVVWNQLTAILAHLKATNCQTVDIKDAARGVRGL